MGGIEVPGQPAYLTSPERLTKTVVGDEAAVPAIGTALEALPDNAIGKKFSSRSPNPRMRSR